MQSINEKATYSTPNLIFKPKEGKIELSGRSMLENSWKWYDVLIDYLKEYVENPAQQTTVSIDLEYFDTRTSKYLMNMLKKLSTINKEAGSIFINWFYNPEDTDMFDMIGDYQELICININKIEKSN